MPSTKLCVTVAARLSAKYPAAARRRIDAALARWIRADAARGITTVVVALDDARAMARLGAAAIAGRVTAPRAKRAIDALCLRLAPQYVVILGGNDIVPYFKVANPSFDLDDGDDDSDVLTDNPYACSTPFRAADRKSYLVPDRVLGRITDLDDDSDPRWIVDQLDRAAAWSPQPPAFYRAAYAVCCSSGAACGKDCMRHLDLPPADLMISPPIVDGAPLARRRLSRTVHMVKCHGAKLEAAYAGQRGDAFPNVLSSADLKGRVSPGTLVAAMCCFGAQIYSPADVAAKPPGELPVAAAYLREGALAVMGATRIAWVGPRSMMCADWIVCGYIKAFLAGASLGRALLESKQDYVRWLETAGQAPDLADEKTLIEFILLGDPSVHPVALSAPAGARVAARAAAASGERAQRRAVRAELAGTIRRRLPERNAVAQPSADVARRLLRLASVQLQSEGQALPALQPARARASHLVSNLDGAARPAAARVAAAARPPDKRESIEYYWSARRQSRNGMKEMQLLKVEVDPEGNFLRLRLLHSA